MNGQSNATSRDVKQPQSVRPGLSSGWPALYTAFLTCLGVISLMAGYHTARKTLPLPLRESTAPVVGPLASASPARLPAREITRNLEISHLAPQQQAEGLLERAIQRDETALDLIRENVDAWRGHVQNTDRLFDLVLAALNSPDLRVRTAAVDIDLAANNLSKSPHSVMRLIHQLQQDPAGRAMALWRLGSLGNRGVEPEKVLNNLLKYAQDRNEHTRYWAVEGLAMLGTDATLDPLLGILAHDASPRVRERAACSLAKSGMLTKEERLAAVPPLLNFVDDDSLNTQTRELIYGALRTITGAALGNDANAWRAWWAQHDTAHERSHQPPGTLRA